MYAAGTDLYASAAGNAFIGVEEQIGAAPLRFRIMTPCASQGAALQKDGCADTGTVVHAKALDLGHA
jgi:hypothetical protein